MPPAKLQEPIPPLPALNTALNVLVFVAAFADQRWIGALLERWRSTTANAHAAEGYMVAFVIMLLLQAARLTWFLLGLRLGRHLAER